MTSDLVDLQHRWGDRYRITGAAGHWIGHRSDSGRMVIASGPAELEKALETDRVERPAVLVRALGHLR